MTPATVSSEGAPTHRNALKTRCPAGHWYTPANTYRLGGRRYCRACGRRRTLLYRLLGGGAR